jgi:hypothetical protein
MIYILVRPTFFFFVPVGRLCFFFSMIRLQTPERGQQSGDRTYFYGRKQPSAPLLTSHTTPETAVRTPQTRLDRTRKEDRGGCDHPEVDRLKAKTELGEKEKTILDHTSPVSLYFYIYLTAGEGRISSAQGPRSYITEYAAKAKKKQARQGSRQPESDRIKKEHLGKKKECLSQCDY